MPYYDTLDEDLARAKLILDKGKPDFAHDPALHGLMQQLDEAGKDTVRRVVGGTIYGADIYAAYKLLESFVATIEQLQHELAQAHHANAEWLRDITEETAESERLRVGLRRAAKVLDDAAEIAGRNDVPQLSQSYAQAADECRKLAE